MIDFYLICFKEEKKVDTCKEMKQISCAKEKTKILIAMPYIQFGGVESTLFSLLNELNPDEFIVTLVLLQKDTSDLSRIPNWISVEEIPIPEKEMGVFYGRKKMLKSYIKKGNLFRIPRFLLYNARFQQSEDRVAEAAYYDRIADSIVENPYDYDVAIDYFGYATFTTFYVAEKVNARLKISWIHSVLSRYAPYPFLKWYEKMDKIYAVSYKAKEDFECMFPKLNNVQVFHNIIKPEKIRALADDNEKYEDGFDGIRILTVGRICEEKGTDIAANVYRRLVNDGHHIRWYIMGDGSKEEKKRVLSLLENEQQKENFVYMGRRTNPYPYMKQCDIYVQPSRFEGYCTATNEARILGCPIVMTDVSGAKEQIQDGVTGRVVGIDECELYKAIDDLICNPEKRQMFRNNLKLVDCGTENEITEIKRVLRNS